MLSFWSVLLRKRALIASLPVALIIAAVWLADHEAYNTGINRIARPRMDALDREAFMLQGRIRTRVNDLFLLRNMAMETLAGMPDSSGVTPAFRTLAISIMRSRAVYDQVRILNSGGLEVFRLNLNRQKDAAGYKIDDAPPQSLQDKSGRPYFKDAIAAPREDAVVSALDLNVEHGQIEMPEKPMVRFSTQIPGPDGKPAGVIVLDYLGNNLLRELTIGSKLPDRTFLLNRDGYWLVGPERASEWAFMYPGHEDQSLAKTDPGLWTRLSSKRPGYFLHDGALYCHRIVDPINDPVDYPPLSMATAGGDVLRFTLVTVVPASMIAADIAGPRRTIWIIGILSSLVIAPAMWFGVTAIKRREEALRKARAAERAKATFLAMMSHEIRTPMNGVLGFAELLADAELSPELHEYAMTIRNTGESLLRIIDNILDFSRIEAARMLIEKAPFSLPETIREVITILSPRARKAGVELRIEIDPRIPATLLGDAGRLRQVLINLAGNSLKFTTHGYVLIRAAFAGDDPLKVEFSVSDTGSGISARQLEKIFQPFVQADAGIAGRHGGSGLGLAISRSLVELMGGSLHAVSEEGLGSTFSFTLTAESAQNLPPEREAAIAKLSAGFAAENPLLILVVDDDAINLKLITLVLRQLGYDALTASSGAEAVDKYRKNKPGCILLDVQMDGMDGTEAARQIRAIERQDDSGPTCYIAALSASVAPKERNTCFEAGMDDYLTKPLRRHALTETLKRAALNRNQPQAEAGQ